MSAERFEIVERIFHAALKLEPAARPAFVRTEIPADAALRKQVESLLNAADHSTMFLETSMLDGPPESRRVPALVPGRMIGPYRVIRELGRGGMGAVYEAEQSNPRRRVALKVVHGDGAGAKLSGHESRILGRLNHPYVANIFDAGSTADGLSYFVMELIEGERLDRFVEAQRLPRRGRLQLFCKICDAIQHAHMKSVIHLDLKPSNILVKPVGSGAGEELQVKVLDFGVSAISGSETTRTIRVGSAGEVQGTLAYMSPEQRRGDQDAADVRSDVYALGVILFKLMTGTLPYPMEGLSYHDAWRVIQEEQPRRPRVVDHGVPRDVDTIICTATADEPGRRYQSVAEFGGDVRRYLADQPIMARRPSKFYEWTKFAQRNKGLAATLLAILVGATTTTIGTATALNRARRAEAQLRVRLEREVMLSEFLTSFRDTGEEDGRGGGDETDPRASAVQGRHLLELKRSEARRALEAGRIAEAEREYERLLEIAKVILEPDNWYIAVLQGDHGECLIAGQRYPRAEEELLASYHRFLAQRGLQHPRTVQAVKRLVQLYTAWQRWARVDEWTARLEEARSAPASSQPVE